MWAIINHLPIGAGVTSVTLLRGDLHVAFAGSVEALVGINTKLLSCTEDSEDSPVRRWPRYHVDVRVAADVRSGGNTITQRGWGTDISEGGLAVYLACELVLGEEIDMELALPYSTIPIRVTGAVRNRDGFKYGIEFTLITSDQQAMIVRACSALALLQ